MTPHALMTRCRRFLLGHDQRGPALADLARALHAAMPPGFPVGDNVVFLRAHAAAAALAVHPDATIDVARIPFPVTVSGLPELDDLMRASLVMHDPPAHTRLRRILARFFTARRLRALADDIRRSLTARFADLLADRAEVEFVSEVAEPLVLATSRRLLGWQAADPAMLHRWARLLADQIMRFRLEGEERAEVEATLAAFRAFPDEERARRRARRPAAGGDGDLYDALLAAEDAGEIASAEEFAGQCLLLLVNGLDTGPTFYAALVRRLLEDADIRARLRADPSLLPGFVEESLRLDGSVAMMVRVAAADLSLGPLRIPRARVVIAGIAVANRDPEVFPAPDRFDPARDPNPHLAFGRGHHHCLGAALARIHATALIEALLTLPRPPRVVEERIVWNPKPAIAGPMRMPLAFG
ncbi:MAG: hypothetical protein KatS3mg119_1167 [Rhodothalassiaceae bacterium]|nr:MAG: hypothetical protein KatS3mg119_1167 [Rhodothalassiaceae bacterium]